MKPPRFSLVIVKSLFLLILFEYVHVYLMSGTCHRYYQVVLAKTVAGRYLLLSVGAAKMVCINANARGLYRTSTALLAYFQLHDDTEPQKVPRCAVFVASCGALNGVITALHGVARKINSKSMNQSIFALRQNRPDWPVINTLSYPSTLFCPFALFKRCHHNKIPSRLSRVQVLRSLIDPTLPRASPLLNSTVFRLHPPHLRLRSPPSTWLVPSRPPVNPPVARRRASSSPLRPPASPPPSPVVSRSRIATGRVSFLFSSFFDIYPYALLLLNVVPIVILMCCARCVHAFSAGIMYFNSPLLPLEACASWFFVIFAAQMVLSDLATAHAHRCIFKRDAKDVTADKHCKNDEHTNRTIFPPNVHIAIVEKFCFFIIVCHFSTCAKYCM